MPGTIARFDGTEHRWLSKFHPAPITIDGETWPTVEHYYQAMKATDPKAREAVRQAATPTDAKAMGRKVTLRQDWESVKRIYMRRGVEAKFAQHSDLQVILLKTGDALLVEGNLWHDNEWGVCYCGEHRCSGYGKNLLGELLMQVRSQLMTQKAVASLEAATRDPSLNIEARHAAVAALDTLRRWS